MSIHFPRLGQIRSFILCRHFFATHKDGPDGKAICQARIDRLGEKVDFTSLANAQRTAHRELFDRVTLQLGPDDQEAVPTDERLANV
jgi:hypothetical protein